MLFKVLLIGDPGVGKPEILRRYSDAGFHSSFISTVGEKCLHYYILVSQP